MTRGLLVVLLAASGCIAVSTQAAKTLTAEPCRDISVPDARCATLNVFENRATKSGRTIPLHIVILPAKRKDRAPDAVFSLAGGPGQAATRSAPFVGRQPLREHRDFVFVDQRGTGDSHGLTCRFYGPPSDVQSYFGDFMPIDRVRTCRDQLSRDADLTQYTTSNSVEDLDDVRAALGYPQVDLLAVSYGTRLAMEYVRAHEAQTRAVILYGAVPPSEAMPEHFGTMAQRALDGVLAECEGTPACHDAFPDIQQEAERVFERLRQKAVTTPLAVDGRNAPVVLTRDTVAEDIRYMTYTSAQASDVPLYLHRAAEGDFSPIAEDAWQRRRSGTFDGLYLAITCTEDVPFLSPHAAEDDERTYLGGYRVRQQRAACAQWPAAPAPSWHDVPVRARTPIVFINGLLDPVTPPPFAAEIRRTLPNSLEVLVRSGGHGLAGVTHRECLDRIERAFIESGTVAGLDTGCVAQMTRAGFVLR